MAPQVGARGVALGGLAGVPSSSRYGAVSLCSSGKAFSKVSQTGCGMKHNRAV